METSRGRTGDGGEIFRVPTCSFLIVFPFLEAASKKVWLRISSSGRGFLLIGDVWDGGVRWNGRMERRRDGWFHGKLGVRLLVLWGAWNFHPVMRTCYYIVY